MKARNANGALPPTGQVDLEFWLGQIRLQQCRLRIQNRQRRCGAGCVQQSGVRVGPDQRYRRVVAE